MAEQEGRSTEERSEPQEEDSMQDLLDAHADDFTFAAPKRGDILTGSIVTIERNEILIDVGYKSEGVIRGREFDKIPEDVFSELKEGDEIQTHVVVPEDNSGHLILGLSRPYSDRDWQKAEELFESQEMFEGEVTGHNKGGLIVKIGKVRGFVPASQLVSTGARESRDGRAGGRGSKESRWASMTGQELRLKVIEIDRERNRLILSERAAMREWRKVQKEKLLSELNESDIREGKVISLADFGAFVDLGGADGLVHLSELSWKRVNHPRDVLRVGQQIRVQIINVDRERKRIGLSLKRLEMDPWEEVEDRFKVDQLIEGTITKLAKFGAFARIAGNEEIEGLIHVSELSDKHVNHPREIVEEGQLVTLRIIRIDSRERRLGLSLKRVAQGEYADVDWEQGLAQAMQDDDSSEVEPVESESVQTSETESQESASTEMQAESGNDIPPANDTAETQTSETESQESASIQMQAEPEQAESDADLPSANHSVENQTPETESEPDDNELVSNG